MLISRKVESLPALLLAVIACSPALSAREFDDDVEEPTEIRPGPARPDVRGLIPVLVTPPALRELVEQLSWKIDDLDEVCRLDDDQKRKFRLAGQGDIQRLLKRVEDLRVKSGSQDGSVELDRLAELLPEGKSLQQSLNLGLFEEGSIFSKTQRRILTADQVARLESDTMLSAPAWTDDFREAQDRARKLNRPLLVNFHTGFAGPCRRMEKVLKSPGVVRTIRRKVVGVIVDIEKKSAQPLLRQFRVSSVPSNLLITPDGVVLGHSVGFTTEEQFLEKLREFQIAASEWQERGKTTR